MSENKPELICAVRGSLHGGRAICGDVGVGEPWKCWHDGECEHQREKKNAAASAAEEVPDEN